MACTFSLGYPLLSFFQSPDRSAGNTSNVNAGRGFKDVCPRLIDPVLPEIYGQPSIRKAQNVFRKSLVFRPVFRDIFSVHFPSRE